MKCDWWSNAHYASIAVAMLVAGCATPASIPPGTSQADVQARLGAPHEVYHLPDGTTRWLYPTQPAGEYTWAADVDGHGRVVSIKQVLTIEEFGQARIGQWTTRYVLVHFGRPVETAYFPLMRRHVWSYRFLQDGVWYSMMHFYFDPDGILRLTQAGPDPEEEQN
jgi:hypothetical protein